MTRADASLEMTKDAPASELDGGSDVELRGVLHVFVAFDWGDEVDLAHAGRLVPAELHVLPRTTRTPPSIRYTPAPLRFRLGPFALRLAGMDDIAVEADAIVFDFAAVAITLRVPLQTTRRQMTRLADWLADATSVVETARSHAEPLFARLRPAIQRPAWSELSEEYFVFQLPPQPDLLPPGELMQREPSWLASLVRLEAGPLSPSEVHEASRARMSYSPEDLIVADWAAAVVVDRDCDEVLETIAFANLQLLELRQIDGQLDERLEAAWDLMHRLARTWLPFWRSHARPVRVLGELKVDANETLARTGNALKLIGDQYLARVYRMLVARFQSDEWGASIRRSLGVLEGIHDVVASQAATFRTEVLEATIVLLIVFEIVMAFFRV